jgi:cell pole-organizing protein PopZ
MTQAAKAQEPSMEEILASIRRIIADDEPNKSGNGAAAAPAPAAAPRPVAAPVAPPAAAAPAVAAAPPANVPQSQDDIDAMFANDMPAEPEPEPATDEADSNVLDLTEAMAASVTEEPEEPEAPVFRTISAEPDVFFNEPPAAAARTFIEPPVFENVQAAEPAAVPPYEPPLVSSSTAAAVDSAFNTLAHTVLVQNARTLEDLVREMLRPMLKSWLDDNLPGLVERLVRAEIERVSRGR